MSYLGEDNPKLMGLMRFEEGCSLGTFAQQAQGFVADLIALHPIFGGLGILDGTRGPYPLVASDASNVAELVCKWGWARDIPEGYDHHDANGQLTAESRPLGTLDFALKLTNLNKNWDDKVSVGASRRPRSGKLNLRGVINIYLPRATHPEFRQDLALARRLMKLVVAHWPIQMASFGLHGIRRTLSWGPDAPRGRTEIEINWLTYIDDPAVASALPAGVQVNPLGSGILMQLAPEILSHHKPEHIALGKAVRESLRAAGKLTLPKPAMTADVIS
jgi:hypothetical protein